MLHKNTVEFEVFGDYAMFSNPIMRAGGEKCSYHIPTYEALKGIASSIYKAPPFIWEIVEVRVMNPIITEEMGMRTLKYNAVDKNDLSYYTYLKNVRYQIRARFVWNKNRPETADDRNEGKYYNIIKRMIKKGGRMDVFLGTRDCLGYVKPCVFGEDTGAYDTEKQIDFGMMYHGITYADEAFSDDTYGNMTVSFWNAVMKYGVIKFKKPYEIPAENRKTIGKSEIKRFLKKGDKQYGTFSKSL